MRSKTIVLATTAALGASLFAGTLAAHGAAGGKMFEKLDTDGNGTVSQAEARAGQDRWFARLDADGDGTISREEFQAMADRRFAKFDLDGNGEVTRDELTQAKEKRKDNTAE
jgi:hypothetical protein